MRGIADLIRRVEVEAGQPVVSLGFAKGVREAAWDGVKGRVSGVKDLATDVYKFGTDKPLSRASVEFGGQ